jgi:hypothetical protein
VGRAVRARRISVRSAEGAYRSGGLGRRRWWLSLEGQHIALWRCRGEPLPVRVPFDADGWLSGYCPSSRFQG